MQLFTKNLALLTLAAGIALAGVGCDNVRDDKRPDMDTIGEHEHGLQSRDLREMATLLAPSVLQIPEVARNPYRVTIVMKHMDNQTEDMRGRDLDIYLARLKGSLNNGATSSSLLFVEERQVTEGLQATEGAGMPIGEDVGRGPNTSTRIVPQFALYGTLYSQRNGRSTYYLFDMKLTNIATGAQVWNQQYEVKSLD